MVLTKAMSQARIEVIPATDSDLDLAGRKAEVDSMVANARQHYSDEGLTRKWDEFKKVMGDTCDELSTSTTVTGDDIEKMDIAMVHPNTEDQQ